MSDILKGSDIFQKVCISVSLCHVNKCKAVCSSLASLWRQRFLSSKNSALGYFSRISLRIFKVHGDGSPAGQAQLLANDAILFVDDKDVTDMKHPEVVQHIRSNRGLTMKMVVERFDAVSKWRTYSRNLVSLTILFRGDHVIPSISEAFPNPDWPKEASWC